MARNPLEPRFQSLVNAPSTFSEEGTIATLRDLAKSVGTDPPFKILAVGARGDSTNEQILSGVGAGAIAVALQVVDPRGRPLFEPFLIEACISTTADGAPGGTQTVGAPSIGSIRRTETANQYLVYRSDASGRVSFTVTAAAGTRYLQVSVCGMVHVIKLVWS